MRWIIKHNPSENYICSKQLVVCNCEFARKFKSVRQARVYLGGSSFDKDKCSIIEYYRDKPEYNIKITEKDIADRILRNMHNMTV